MYTTQLQLSWPPQLQPSYNTHLQSSSTPELQPPSALKLSSSTHLCNHLYSALQLYSAAVIFSSPAAVIFYFTDAVRLKSTAFYSKAAVFYSSLQPSVLRIASFFSYCYLLIHSCSHVGDHNCNHLLLHN
jgi:hypothetical protein